MLEFENRAANADHYCQITSYGLGKLIDTSNCPFCTRVYALAIPVICFAAETAKAVVDLQHLGAMGYHAVTSLKIENGNVQSGVMHVSEHLRNIAGVVSGLFLGLYSPQLARKSFLTVEAKKLQMKLNPTSAAKLYSLGFALSHFFSRHELDYRICSGTLLGAIRHGGIIPWDDDIDIMLHPNSSEKFKRLVDDGTFERETGLKIKWQPFTGGWQCFHADSPLGEGLLEEIGLPFVDIFYTRFDAAKQKIEYSTLELRQLSTGDYFTPKEWSETKEYSLGPIKLLGVKDSAPYTTRSYGRDALHFAYQTMHHEDLAKMVQRPFALRANVSKVWKYGLPRRAYLADKSAINYSEQHYQTYNRIFIERFESSVSSAAASDEVVLADASCLAISKVNEQ